MITRLGQLDFVRPIRSFEYNPSRHASEVDNYLDAIQTTGVGDYISKTGSSDTFEREDKRNKSNVSLTARDENFEKRVDKDRNWMSAITGLFDW